MRTNILIMVAAVMMGLSGSSATVHAADSLSGNVYHAKPHQGRINKTLHFINDKFVAIQNTGLFNVKDSNTGIHSYTLTEHGVDIHTIVDGMPVGIHLFREEDDKLLVIKIANVVKANYELQQ